MHVFHWLTKYNFSLENEVKRNNAGGKEDKGQIAMLEPFQKYFIHPLPFNFGPRCHSLNQEENENIV